MNQLLQGTGLEIIENFHIWNTTQPNNHYVHRAFKSGYNESQIVKYSKTKHWPDQLTFYETLTEKGKGSNAFYYQGVSQG